MDGVAVRSVLCEVGPATVRSLHWGTGESAASADPRLAEAALAFDEAVAVVDGVPVAADELWRRTLTPLLAEAASCVLIHPSWWPSRRAAGIAEAARGLVGGVETASRALVLEGRFPGTVVVEIAPHLVLLVAGGSDVVGAESRRERPDAVADAVVRIVRGLHSTRSICIDTPTGVHGGRSLAAMIADRLRPVDIAVRRVDHRDLASAAQRPAASDALEPTRNEGRWQRPVAIVTAAAALAAVAAWSARHQVDPPVPVEATKTLIEGSVAAQIPADWTVRHVTAGPGSARVEAVSPHDPGAVLHITQARVPSDELSASAAALRIALDSQPPGVFVDFNPTDTRAGRRAVTYREQRPNREIRWTVVVDAGVRIGVGCQNADAICERAIRTARRIR